MNPFIVSLIIGLLCANAHAGEIQMQDFSEGYILQVKENSAIHSVELPQAIYETLIQEDLGDLCVFNGNGNPVPYFIKAVEKEERLIKKREVLPFFPLSLPQTQRDSANENISVMVSRNSSGTIVKVSPFSADHLKSEIINAYLIDLSNTIHQVSELEFSWHQNAQSTLINLTIEQSDDLISWSTLVAKASLANIRYMGKRVTKRKVVLGLDTKKYLKVSWAPEHAFMVTEVVGNYSQVPQDKSFYWTEAIAARQVSSEKESFAEFILEKKIQPERVQVVLPEKPALQKLRILSKKANDKNWARRCDTLFYDFRVDGSGLSNDPCTFSATKDSEWRVENVEFSNGYDQPGELKIKFGWRRHELLFVSQGVPPFMLAFGSGKFTNKTSSVQNQTILNAFEKNPMRQEVQRAEILKKVEIGGEKALELPKAPLPWKKWILWFVLIVGVAFLAYMVRNLMTELKGQKGS